MGFELYETSMCGERQAMVGLRKDCTISFNRMAQKHLRDYDRVQLFYDRGRHVIAIKPVTKETPNSFAIRRYERERTVEVLTSSKGFFEFYNLPRDSRKRIARYEDGMLVVQLEREVKSADPLRVFHGEKAS